MVYTFVYNGKVHYLIPTIHYDYNLIDKRIIRQVEDIISNVDVCAFEIDSVTLLKYTDDQRKKMKVNPDKVKFKDVYTHDDMSTIKHLLKKHFRVDLPLLHIQGQNITTGSTPLDIIANYDFDIGNGISYKQKYLDIYFEKMAIAKNKTTLMLDSITKMKKLLTSANLDKKVSRIQANPVNIPTIGAMIDLGYKNIKDYTKLFSSNKGFNVVIDEETKKEAERRNRMWIKKIIQYLDRHPNQSMAIIVGTAHIFGFGTDKDNTLPVLLSNVKGVSDVKWGTRCPPKPHRG